MMKTAKTYLIWIGGGTLLLAACAEGIAVLSRHVGIPFLGSIELVQVFVLFSGASALIVATEAGKHAVVHLLKDRMTGKSRKVLGYFSAFLSACFMAFLLVGSLWIVVDMWSAYEESELIHAPYKPLRLYAAASLFVIIFLFLQRGFRKGEAK